LLGILLLIPVHLSKAKELDVHELSKALESERWQDRVAALKILQDKPIDVATVTTYQMMRTSPHVAERSWLARALGVSRKTEAYDDLIAFLDDPNPNVVSMAFYALGKKGDGRAIKEIMARIKESGSWYNQWYAYKALRSLGWKQTRSKQKR
jgi:HEAT repeat protein